MGVGLERMSLQSGGYRAREGEIFKQVGVGLERMRVFKQVGVGLERMRSSSRWV